MHDYFSKKVTYKPFAAGFYLMLTLGLSDNANAGIDAFTKGPVLEYYGENAPVKHGINNAAEQKFKVAFDVYEIKNPAEVTRDFNTIARFINMHVRAGVPLENIQVAIVVHGKASTRLLDSQAYQARFESVNADQDLLEQLMQAGASIELCGQSAAAQNIAAKDLMPGINVSLSAMTAHALLQQQGYTLNPF